MLVVALFFVTSCSVEKNTSATRNFHNLTSHYNIFFNATESYKKGVDRAREGYMDDFTSVLPLFFYEDESVQQSVSSQMKRAIDKSTKVITFHSITAKPKVKSGKQTEKDKAFYDKNEYNKWVDDSYLLIGKAYMYQGEFFMAAESFKHVLNNYETEDSYFQAIPWLIRANNVIGDLDNSEELLVGIRDIDEYPEEALEVLYTSLADYHIRRKNFAEAAENLEKALETRPKKEDRIRYTFILAQLYTRAGEGDKSIENYKKVIRMNPPYVMAFNAKVSMAEALESGSANSDEIRKLLVKMLKDSKNKEFQDQIYFALGNIYMEEGDREKAIEYYHLSVLNSIQNNYQKGESCLTLADIYYKEPQYTLSAAYYDTAVNLLSDDYPNYNMLSKRSQSLNGLVYNVSTFELQDSLQVLAGLSDVERNAVIDDIIQKVREEEEEARRRQQEALQNLAFARSDPMSNSSGFNNNGQAGGKWYFYNMSVKGFGQSEFRMKWGDRKLEDNWRRSNKQSMSALMEAAGMGQEENMEGEGGVIIDNKSREYYLRNIPLTDSALQVSNTKLEEALYNMGMIYRDELLDYQKAVDALEELVRRYPQGEYTMSSYYYLHDLYNTLQQPAQANVYKDLLSRNYPDSHMAKLLTNPNYIKELEQEQNKVEVYYSDLYEQYRNENYREVIRKADQGMREYAEFEEMLPRMAYLKAMSIGAIRGKEAMKIEMDSIIAQYPGTEIAAEASEIIDYLYVAFPVIKEEEQAREAVDLYTYNPVAKHQFMLAVKSSHNLNMINFNLLNYNLDNFNTYDLKINMYKMDDGYNLLVVGEFSNMEGTKRYMDRVRQDIADVLGEINEDDYEILLVSAANMDTLKDQKLFKPYLFYYKQNYQE